MAKLTDRNCEDDQRRRRRLKFVGCQRRRRRRHRHPGEQNLGGSFTIFLIKIYSFLPSEVIAWQGTLFLAVRTFLKW